MPIRRVALGEIGEVVRENIRIIRTEKELTQAELANMADLPSQSITEIENGARRVNVDDLVAIARALGVPFSKILGANK
jgi:transcriptional regulator with XRE-family HTH domain